MSTHFIPLFNNHKLHFAIGFVLSILSPMLASNILRKELVGIEVVFPLVLLTWLPAVYLTDKYVHKYPQRYYTYLLASHIKAAVVMAFLLLIICLAAGASFIPFDIVWFGFIIFILTDALVSVPHRSVFLKKQEKGGDVSSVGEKKNNKNNSELNSPKLEAIDTNAIKKEIDSAFKGSMAEFINEHLPKSKSGISKVMIIDDIPVINKQVGNNESGLVVGRIRLNDVKRLNLYLQFCATHIVFGGYMVVSYRPLEEVTRDLKRRYRGILFSPAFFLHFIWYRVIPKIPWIEKIYFSQKLSWLDNIILRKTKWRSRVLSKAEVWGRLAFYGMEVLAEAEIDNDRYIIAQRLAQPVLNRKPSYYSIVALEKVGLDGKIFRLHKVRSMYPFSEFLQKNIFETHGLTSTGKFKDDFRLTEYGQLIRRHWIDELPGIFDWLRGDIKLVGMRATSPHFLSLYPKELYDLYIQIKPGLIPPIFDESTDGFKQIVKIELTYLQRYIESPIKTDVLYFWYTFRDIFIRKVRSS